MQVDNGHYSTPSTISPLDTANVYHQSLPQNASQSRVRYVPPQTPYQYAPSQAPVQYGPPNSHFNYTHPQPLRNIAPAQSMRLPLLRSYVPEPTHSHPAQFQQAIKISREQQSVHPSHFYRNLYQGNRDHGHNHSHQPLRSNRNNQQYHNPALQHRIKR
jgi:hypothetical protein